MADRELNIRKIIDHWRESSDKDYQTMINLFISGDYNWALFLQTGFAEEWKLVIENLREWLRKQL